MTYPEFAAARGLLMVERLAPRRRGIAAAEAAEDRAHQASLIALRQEAARGLR